MLTRLRNRWRRGARATTEIRDLPARGAIKVVGKARPAAQLLKAPITGRSCVFYCVDIGEWFNGTKTPLLSEQSREAFFIEDETGRALIDPKDSESQLRPYRMLGHSGGSHAEHRALLARHGFTMVDDYGELRSLAFAETIIPPDARICALGSVVRRANPSGAASYREQPQQSVIQSDSTSPLLLTEF